MNLEIFYKALEDWGFEREFLIKSPIQTVTQIGFQAIIASELQKLNANVRKLQKKEKIPSGTDGVAPKRKEVIGKNV